MNDIIKEALEKDLKRNEEYYARKRKELNKTFLIIGIGICIYFCFQFGMLLFLL